MLYPGRFILVESVLGSNIHGQVALLKGPKRSFVVFLVVIVGVESCSKNVLNRTKIVHGNKKCAREQKTC